MLFNRVTSEISGAIHAFHRFPVELDKARDEIKGCLPDKTLNSKINGFKKTVEELKTKLEKFEREVADFEDEIFDYARKSS